MGKGTERIFGGEQSGMSQIRDKSLNDHLHETFGTY
jgi:hypothetical protein